MAQLLIPLLVVAAAICASADALPAAFDAKKQTDVLVPSMANGLPGSAMRGFKWYAFLCIRRG